MSATTPNIRTRRVFGLSVVRDMPKNENSFWKVVTKNWSFATLFPYLVNSQSIIYVLFSMSATTPNTRTRQVFEFKVVRDMPKTKTRVTYLNTWSCVRHWNTKYVKSMSQKLIIQTIHVPYLNTWSYVWHWNKNTEIQTTHATYLNTWSYARHWNKICVKRRSQKLSDSKWQEPPHILLSVNTFKSWE